MTDAALAAQVAREAGELLLQVRDEVGFRDPYDLGDAGDKRANVLILDRLREERPDDAVLSEEAPDNLARVRSDRVWIVDPVDGTREFSMRGHTDWAVHIALWQRSGGARGGITDAAVALPAVGRGLPHRHRGATAAAQPGADSHRHQRQPAPDGAVVAARRARHRVDRHRLGGRQGDGRGPR